jgi:hypothetical protein
MPAVPGVTTVFTLNPNTSTLLSAPRADPNGRFFIRIDNLDKRNAIAFGFGTNNQVTSAMHQIPPGSYYEFRWQSPSGGGPLPQPSWGPQGDISAIAVSVIGGNPAIYFTEV